MREQIGPNSLAVGSYVPTSPTTWLVFIASFIALVALRYGFSQLSIKRQAAKLDGLLKESAAFALSWPRERLPSAPHDDLAAEAIRCQKILSLLRQLRAAKKSEREQFDSQIRAVEGWLTTVHAALNTARAQGYWEQGPPSQSPPR
jgi:hypothetical protein